MTYPIEFKGNGWEYFKIYFVNLALSIITLGIYSAWAKVRNKRYFYGNTSLAGSGFEYHASPIQILKGRLLVVGVFIIYNITIGLVPSVDIIFILLFFAFIPWLILKATQFNMRNSSYRYIRFDFVGQLGTMFKYYIGLPILSIFTLGLAYPYAVYKQKKYLGDMTRFGQSAFHFNGSSKTFFKTYFIALLPFILLPILLGFFFGPSLESSFPDPQTVTPQHAQPMTPYMTAEEEVPPIEQADTLLVVFGMYGVVLLGSLFVMTYINTRITNYFFNNLKLDYVRFKADIGYWKLMGIYLTNLLLILVTLGLFIPWAKVRAVKYKLSCVTLFSPDLEGHLASETEQMKALSEEVSDFMDIDVGL